MRLKKILSILIVWVISWGLIIGCQGGQQEQRLEAKPKHDKERIPEVLTTMDERVHSIISSIEGIEEINQLKPEDLKPQEQQQQQEGQSQAQESEGDQSGGGSSQSDQEGQQEGGQQQDQPSLQEQQEKIEMEKQAQILEKWESAQDKIKSLHESWNGYESSAKKDGGDQQKIDKVEKALNALTTNIEAKNEEAVLNASNDMILFLSDFMGLYKGNVNGTLGKIEYLARQCYMDAKEDNWQAAGEKVQEKDSLIDTLRQIANIEKKQEPLLEKLNLSLEDLQKAVEENDLALLKIKRDIVIKNIDTLKQELK